MFQSQAAMNYYPIIFSINYKSQGSLHAFMCYGQFTKDSTYKITGVQIIKQVILVSLNSPLKFLFVDQ